GTEILKLLDVRARQMQLRAYVIEPTVDIPRILREACGRKAANGSPQRPATPSRAPLSQRRDLIQGPIAPRSPGPDRPGPDRHGRGWQGPERGPKTSLSPGGAVIAIADAHFRAGFRCAFL